MPAIAVLAAIAASGTAAQSLAPARAQTGLAAPATAEQGVRWRDLRPEQQRILRPLEAEWSRTDAARKQKWLDIAARFPGLPPAEQERIQTRMAEWARLTPDQRGQARQNFQAAKGLPAQERQAQWEAYQKLSPEEKRRLATRAAPPPPTTPSPSARGAVPRPGDAERAGGGRAAAQAKSNIVPNPAHAAPARRVTPTTLQAQPGATTTNITRRPAPPLHQQTGLPKISATPTFVDKATLLPRRGAQAAATRSAAASAPSAETSR